MRTATNFPRSILALTITGVLLGFAPAVPAQQFVPVVGTPIAYQVDLPVEWEVTREDEMLMAGDDVGGVMIAAQDALAGDDGRPLPASEARARRIRAERLMNADSLLAAVAGMFVSDEEMEIRDVTREMRTLGGHQAVFVRGHAADDEGSGWFQVYLTIKDGVMYMLVCAVQGEDPTSYDQVFARIHESFVLADARR